MYDVRHTDQVLLERPKFHIDVSPVLNGVFVEEQRTHCISNYSNCNARDELLTTAFDGLSTFSSSSGLSAFDRHDQLGGCIASRDACCHVAMRVYRYRSCLAMAHS